MAQRSRFFDSSGGDRIYTSDAWAQVVGAIIGDGVVASGNELAVAEASPPAMSVRVNTGRAFIGGYYFEVHTGQETLAVSAAHATLARIDRVVVRRDLAGRTATLAVLAGTPAESPTPPALSQVAAGVWEIPLASIAVAPAAASIVDANITDERGPRAKGTDIENLQATLLDVTTGHRHEGTAGSGRVVRHADLGGLTSDNHHAKSHSHSGDGSGSVAHAATTGLTATDHHAAPVAGPDANVTVDAAGAAGTAGAFARAAHGHQVATSGATPADVAAAGASGATGAIARAAHVHAHGSGYLPDAHHPQTHALNSHTGTAADISAWAKASAGGGAAGVKVWVGTTDPGAAAAEGDIWVKK
jgi:hypothetical protein